MSVVVQAGSNANKQEWQGTGRDVVRIQAVDQGRQISFTGQITINSPKAGSRNRKRVTDRIGNRQTDRIITLRNATQVNKTSQ